MRSAILRNHRKDAHGKEHRAHQRHHDVAQWNEGVYDTESVFYGDGAYSKLKRSVTGERPWRSYA